MDGWVDGYMDRWIHESMDAWMEIEIEIEIETEIETAGLGPLAERLDLGLRWGRGHPRAQMAQF